MLILFCRGTGNGSGDQGELSRGRRAGVRSYVAGGKPLILSTTCEVTGGHLISIPDLRGVKGKFNRLLVGWFIGGLFLEARGGQTIAVLYKSRNSF